LNSKCWAIQDNSKHNLSIALQFGDLEILCTRDYPMFQGGDACTSDLKRRLSLFNAHDDYLILIGDPILIGLTFAVLAQQGIKKLRILKWDRFSTNYIPVNVEL
jgi:hypothetical protein